MSKPYDDVVPTGHVAHRPGHGSPNTTVSGWISVKGPRGMRPAVPFMPTRPLNPAGMRIEPPPSPPRGDGDQPAGHRRADPPDEPPGGAAVLPRVVRDAVDLVDAHVEPAELAGVAQADGHGAGVEHPLDVESTCGRPRSPSKTSEQCVVGPALDLGQRLHAERDAAEGQGDVGRRRRRRGPAPRRRVTNALSCAGLDGGQAWRRAPRPASVRRTGRRRRASRCHRATGCRSCAGSVRERISPVRAGIGSAPMDAGEFLGLAADPQPAPLVPAGHARASPRGGRFLFGGCGLGAAIVGAGGRDRPSAGVGDGAVPVVRAVDEVMDVDVTVASTGHSPPRPASSAHVGDREILTVNAASGARPDSDDGQWARCRRGAAARRLPAAASAAHRGTGSIMERLDMRLARGSQWDELDGQPGDRRALRAVGPDPRHRDVGRRPGRSSVTTCRSASGRRSARGGGTSLDNTLRGPSGRPDRVGVARHPGPRRAQRVRPRPRAPVGRGRHAAGYGQPELRDRPADPPGPRRARSGDASRPVQRYGMTIPFDGVPLSEHAEWIRRARRPRLHRRLVGGGRRRRRRSRRWRWPSVVGAVAATRHGHHPGVHPRARPAWPSRWRRSPTPRPVGSSSGVGTSSNVIVERWNGIPFEEPYQPGAATWCASSATR